MNLVDKLSQRKLAKWQVILFAVLIFVIISVVAFIVGFITQNAYLAVIVFIIATIGFPTYLFKKGAQNKTAEEKAKDAKLSLRALYVILIVYVVISLLISFNELIKDKIQPNACLNQELNKPDEETARKVIDQFENFQIGKDIKGITTCSSSPIGTILKDKLSLYSFQIIKISQADSKSFLAEVRENYSQYVDGISGGSWKYVPMVGYFRLMKDNQQWKIDSYYRSLNTNDLLKKF